MNFLSHYDDQLPFWQLHINIVEVVAWVLCSILEIKTTMLQVRRWLGHLHRRGQFIRRTDIAVLCIVVGMKVAPLPSCRTGRHILSLSPSSQRTVPVGITLSTKSLIVLIFKCNLGSGEIGDCFCFLRPFVGWIILEAISIMNYFAKV